MSGCLILMLSGPTELDDDKKSKKEGVVPTLVSSPPKPFVCKAPVKAKVYTMRGYLDVFSTGMYTLAQKIHEKLGMKTQSISYLEEKKLSKYLINDYQSSQCKAPIILIGHSYGADEQVTVAKRLNEAHVPVEVLITLDNTKPQNIPPNVRRVYNINSGHSIASPIIPWGSSLTPESKQTKVINVDLMKDKGFKDVNHFNIDKLPEVQEYIVNLL